MNCILGTLTLMCQRDKQMGWLESDLGQSCDSKCCVGQSQHMEMGNIL
jgi:hypothetical protein